MFLAGKCVIFDLIMKKYLIGAAIPIILYVLYVFVSPFWVAYRYSLRERFYTEHEFYSDAIRPPSPCETVQTLSGNKKNKALLYTPQNWFTVIQTLSLVSKRNDALKKQEFYKHRPIILDYNFLQQKAIKKIHLRVWNKRSNAKDLLCETVSDLSIGSFAMGKDTFWIPMIQKTQAKTLQGVTWQARGFSVENVLRFYTEQREDNALETNLSLVQNFSAMKNYCFNAQLEDGSSVSISPADISYTLMSFKIVSKNNKYEIVQDALNQERLKKNKYQFNEEDTQRIGLKNLGLDMFELGTIEIEIVK